MNIFCRFFSNLFYDENYIEDFITITHKLENIEKLIDIMAKKQEEFNAKMAEAGEMIGQLSERIKTLEEAVKAETAEIESFKAGLPENVDTSAVEGVLDRLKTTVASSEGLEERVAGIFSTGEATQTVTTDGVTTEVPVSELNVDEDKSEVSETLEPVGQTPEFPEESKTEGDVVVDGTLVNSTESEEEAPSA